MNRKHEIIDRIMEHGIYLYIFFMFLAKGEGIRNILIFGNFILWVFTARQRKNIYLLKEPVSIFFWTYLAVIPFSVIFSIDPLYSFLQLKSAPLKSALLFPVIATVMADEEKLKKAILVGFFTAILLVVAGYYSYIFYDIQLLKPNTWLVHLWHGKFARALCIYLSLSFILFLIWEKFAARIFLAVTFFISVIALILSTSRTGVAAFIGIIIVWVLYLSRSRGYDFRKITASMSLIFLTAVTLLYFLAPDVRRRIEMLPNDLLTFNERAEVWFPAVHAIADKPLTGWGYGKGIFNMEEPYEKIPYKAPPEKGPHNSFLKVLFHQGIIGLIPYTLMIFVPITVFWKYAFRTTGIGSCVLVACVSILVGNYIVQAMTSDLKLYYFSVVLGLGMAAKGIGEDSHN
jgi:O-antigen ligase